MTYATYSDFLARHLDGKIQKISINAGMSCPNRDGTLSRGGCTYCTNHSFTPGYCRPTLSVADQIAAGREFFARKYPQMRYLAYFQSFTNTYAPIPRLMDMYNEALGCEDVAGLVIATRPDMMPQELLLRLAELRRDHFVMVEYGAESGNDSTLETVNRCHTWADTVDAVKRTASCGIPVGLHLIMGLPGEIKEDMLMTIDKVNELPVDVVKIHQLQVLRGTVLADQISRGEVAVEQFTVDQYIELCCAIVQRLRPDIAIDRFVSQSPDELLITPRWGLKNYQFTELLNARLRDLD